MGKHKLTKDELLKRLVELLSTEDHDVVKTQTYSQIAFKAYQLHLLSDYEAESCCEVDYSVLKSYLWTHLKHARAREIIKNVVSFATRMYAVGTRFLGAWVLEKYNEGHFKEEAYFNNTLCNVTFLKHAFRGILSNGTLHEEIANSDAYKAVSSLYPSPEALLTCLDLTAWNNVVGHLVTSYQTNWNLHVKNHLWNRMLAHMKRFAQMNLNAKAVVRNKVKVLEWNDDDKIIRTMPITTLYKALQDGNLTYIPPSLHNEIYALRNAFTDKERDAFPHISSLKITNRIFCLHLYLREKVPFEGMENETEHEYGSTDPWSVVEMSEEKEWEQYSPKGWSPMPIASLMKTHITIDSKVFESLKKTLKLPKETCMRDFFGMTKTAYKSYRNELRRRKRRAKENHGRARKNRHGLGKLPLGEVRSIMTNGIDMCARFCCIRDLSKKPVNEIEVNEFFKKHSPREFGCDPGRANLIQIAEEKAGGGHLQMRLSRTKYYAVTKINHVNQVMREMKQSREGQYLQQVETEMAKVGGWKSRTLDQYLQVLETFKQHSDDFLKFYGQERFMLLNMVTYRRKESAILQRYAKVINAVPKEQRNRPVLFGMGAAQFAPTGKKEQSVPTTRTRKLLVRYLKSRRLIFKVVNIDEFRTTKMCHHCHQELSKVWNPERKCSERKWMICNNTECCGCNTTETGGVPKSRSATGHVLLNRDGNAAINILQCLKALARSQERPTYLNRVASTST